MDRNEVEEYGMDVESYGGGFIVADYSGNRGEASYCGTDGRWTMQPIVRCPFPTEDEAWSFAAKSMKAGT